MQLHTGPLSVAWHILHRDQPVFAEVRGVPPDDQGEAPPGVLDIFLLQGAKDF